MKTPLSHGLPAVHPGQILRVDVLPALGRPTAEIARLLGISRQHLYDLLNEKKPVTPATALRIGKLCGNGPDLWLTMQARHDAWEASHRLAAEVKKIPTLRE